jgi:cytochrome P450 family 6
MPFLCPTEALRMFPPVPFITRECTKPFKLETPSGGSYEIEVGTPVLIPVYSLHYDPQHFPHPEIFDPDRFSVENKKSRHKYIYLPFGEGPRICLGTYESVIIHKSFIATDLE